MHFHQILRTVMALSLPMASLPVMVGAVPGPQAEQRVESVSKEGCAGGKGNWDGPDGCALYRLDRSVNRLSSATRLVDNTKVIDARDPGITQAVSDLYSTIPLPTGPDPTWMKRQIIQGTTDRFSTAAIPTPTRHTSSVSLPAYTQSVAGIARGVPDTFTTVTKPAKGLNLWGFHFPHIALPKRQISQGTTDRFSTVPIPTPTRSRSRSHSPSLTDLPSSASTYVTAGIPNQYRTAPLSQGNLAPASARQTPTDRYSPVSFPPSQATAGSGNTAN